MNLGIRLHDLAPGTLEERLGFAREQGFTCGHLALAKVIKENSVRDAALTPGYAMHLKRLFAEYGVDVAVLGCYLNLADPRQEKMKEIQKRYMTNIRFASWLGCGVVGTETGAPNEAYRFEPACRSREALDILIDNLRPVVRYAEQMGVVMAIEPVYKHIVYNPRRARQVLDTIDSPNLQIILDPVNLLGPDNWQQQDEIVAEALELLRDDIAVIHIKDFIPEGDELKAVAAGEGRMNYTQVLQFIRQEKPYIHVTLENTCPANAIKAADHIRQLLLH